MRIHELSVADAIASLKSRQEGISSVAAQERLNEFGPNQVRKITREPLVFRFLKEFTSYFAIILWVAACLAFLADLNDPGQGMARVAYATIGVILVSGVFSFWQEYRAEQTLAALRKLLPQNVQTLRDGSMMLLPVEQLVPGDIVALEQGDNVPADCRLIEVFGTRVNNATLTGESLPRVCAAEPSQEDELLRSKNLLFAGTSVVAGRAKAVVFATGMNTEFGKIARLTQEEGQALSPLRLEITHLSRWIITLAVVIGLVFFAIGWIIGIPIWEDFIFAIGIIIAMVPEGLLPTLTLALVLATQRMAKRNVLVRHLSSVEALGSTTVICTDKTGTVTQNRMTAKQLFLGNSLYPCAATLQRREVVTRYRALFLTAYLCHDLKVLGRGEQAQFRGDPMEVALVEMALQTLRAAEPYPRIDEIPFDTDRMRQSVVCSTPDGPVLYCKGAPETVLPLCAQALIDGNACELSVAQQTIILKAQETMAGNGLRVIALAYRVLGPARDTAQLEENLIFAGLVGLEDPPRPEVAGAIQKCHEAGVKVIMLTGDHPSTACAIAREIGLARAADPPLVITGEELRHLSGAQLQLLLDAPDVICARVAADQKMRIVEALQQKGHVVAVTGDGVNDAPALRCGNIGIAMGIGGTDVAKEAADMVLLDDNFASIVNGIEEGRAVFDNIRKFLTYILAHNVPELIPYLAFVLFRIPLALTPLQILSVDMGTDSLTALGLGVEDPGPSVMQRPPRPRHERLLNWPVALRAYLFLGSIEAIAAMSAFFFVLYSGGWQYGQTVGTTDALYLQATTACLSAIIVMQIVNVFLCRSAIRSTWATGTRGNRLILWGVLLELALILFIDYTPWGNLLLGTAPINGNVWLFIVPFALALLLLEELRKWIARNMK